MASLSEALSSFSAVIVTGGSSGIGKSFINLIYNVNPELRFCNLSRSKPEMNLSKLKLYHISTDLSRPEQLAGVVGAIGKWLDAEPMAGKILLINNSGFGGYGIFPEPNIEHSLEMIDLNVRAVVELTGRLLPKIQACGGAIINVASTAAFQPTAWMSVYGASKAFLLHWSLALNQELSGTGVNVLALCPGPTATGFFRRAGLQKGSVADSLSMSSDEVVLTSLRAMVAGKSLVVTGWKNRVGVALVTKLPKSWAAWIAAKILEKIRFKRVAR
jgi:uncharacterized protein|uniref:SDR family NAD(P)-dependent oxidoreductase n=2 Tax=Cephaloticoccus sp. TaxID=1985742 RepID=UPI00404B3754